MNATQLTALVSGLTALVGAVAGLVAIIRHVNGPSHQNPAQTPQSGAVVQGDQSRP